MNFEDRLARRRQLALIEAQGLVSLHGIGLQELAELDRELQERQRALAERVREVQELMEAHGISLEDIIDAGPDDPSRVTHRHPVSGLTWNGLGPQPQWLRDALLSEGYRPSELRVQSPQTPDEA